jgi:sugar diacid utilization regulator
VATLSACKVAILSTDYEPLATHPRDLDLAALRLELTRAGTRPDHAVATPLSLELRGGGGWLSVRAVHVLGDPFGYVCLIRDERPGDALEIAVGQAAVITALHHLEERAADEARADARDEIIWDLIHGTNAYQRAAANLAERMRIDLNKAHRLFTCHLDDALSDVKGDPARIDRMRRAIRGIVQRISVSHGGPDLVGLRGNAIVTVTPCVKADAARAMAEAATAEIAALLPGLVTLWGVSRPHDSPLEYRIAYREASIALKAARRLGGGSRAAVFDELGIVRLLLAPGDEPDLDEYVTEVLGPALEYDRKRGTALIKTLRTYLDTDCSLNLAAHRLFVHYKTLRYRLNRVEELTHLHLRHNEDRFRADLALRILDASSLRSSLERD